MVASLEEASADVQVCIGKARGERGCCSSVLQGVQRGSSWQANKLLHANRQQKDMAKDSLRFSLHGCSLSLWHPFMRAWEICACKNSMCSMNACGISYKKYQKHINYGIIRLSASMHKQLDVCGMVLLPPFISSERCMVR